MPLHRWMHHTHARTRARVPHPCLYSRLRSHSRITLCSLLPALWWRFSVPSHLPDLSSSWLVSSSASPLLASSHLRLALAPAVGAGGGAPHLSQLFLFRTQITTSQELRRDAWNGARVRVFGSARPARRARSRTPEAWTEPRSRCVRTLRKADLQIFDLHACLR